MKNFKQFLIEKDIIETKEVNAQRILDFYNARKNGQNSRDRIFNLFNHEYFARCVNGQNPKKI